MCSLFRYSHANPRLPGHPPCSDDVTVTELSLETIKRELFPLLGSPATLSIASHKLMQGLNGHAHYLAQDKRLEKNWFYVVFEIPILI